MTGSDFVRTDTQGVLAVIPARYGSTRLPGKVIMDIAGKPLVQHVYDRVCLSTSVTACVVATDDERVVQALEPYGTEVAMTSAEHRSGTDRVAAVARQRNEPVIVNVQGDEPLIRPEMIDAAIQPVLGDRSIPVSTLCCQMQDEHEVADPDVVKVVTDMRGRALYFSRAPIPVVRDSGHSKARPDTVYRKHIGLYVYRREFLVDYAQWVPTPLEQFERLEQLRVLEHGYPIVVVETEYDSISVDSPSDLDRVRKQMEVSGDSTYA